MPQTTERKSARDRLLETASRLFYQEGLRGVGIDRIIAEAGVAKMSFYRNFPSKNALIVAFLEQRHTRWMEWFQAAVKQRLQTDPNCGLTAIADALAEWFAEPSYRGCAFINAMAEGGVALDPAVRGVVMRHKQELADWVAALAQQLGLDEPQMRAAAAMVAIEGMIVRYQMTGDAQSIAAGRALLAVCGQLPAAQR
ncbi:TetR/AcrR family transcriptional regulator [Magnetofaba australis]|uniref:Putative TetR family transcriptional regulator n=1 Tax=Magnetofaba australis IT-1 TaxID=1434232 RepID=A0A1Y2K4F1_9PROT|nr:TetR/AcrR family transcriptional regulator [Magnetofaba australis]OSM02516.1 putative TetR family transcriptional regulator [Magnetofaba australis IT-1]